MIFWLASYPKSGSTWVRLFLEAYAHGEKGFASLSSTGYLAARETFDRLLQVPSELLDSAGIERLMPAAQWKYVRQWRSESALPPLLKTHSVFSAQVHETESSTGVIQIVRDPRDIVASLANHFDIGIGESVRRLGDRTHRISDRLHLEERVGSWSENVASWSTPCSLGRHLVRYEDLVADPREEFRGLLKFLGVELSEEKLRSAVEATRFSQLRGWEKAAGFREAVPGRAFFRAGRAGGFEQELTHSERRRVENDHREWMVRLGYQPSGPDGSMPTDSRSR